MHAKHGSLGLIAGWGDLPLFVLRDARHKGYRVVLVGLEGLVSDALVREADVSAVYNVGKIGGIFKFLKSHGVTEAVMAGKVPKSVIYDGKLRPDLRAAKVLLTLINKNDDTIIGAVAREFELEGIALHDMKDFLRSHLTPPGSLTKSKPTKDEKKDIEYGFRLAKEIGRLDIGQTVVVKGRAVMAVEAIEGTDAAIRRGGELARGGAVVIKVMRPKQDMRFDVPVVGMGTLEAMREGKIRVLALEAHKSILLERERFIDEAERADIAVFGVEAD